MYYLLDSLNNKPKSNFSPLERNGVINHGSLLKQESVVSATTGWLFTAVIDRPSPAITMGIERCISPYCAASFVFTFPAIMFDTSPTASFTSLVKSVMSVINMFDAIFSANFFEQNKAITP